jgi:CheY-like chemotaxis protein
MLAHELRNPLAPIYNGLSILKRSKKREANDERIHAMLDGQIKHMVRLIDDLLDVSRINLGKIELKREPVDLDKVVQTAVEMTDPLIQAARHRLHIEKPSTPILLSGDSVRLSQVVSNLLSNAAKYTKQGGQIWLSANLEQDWVVIRVRDTGIGMPPEMLERVFELFTQIGDSGGRGAATGLGIGLAMVRKLVELHGGHVQAESAGLGQGSQFTVYLPARIGRSTAQGDRAAPRSEASFLRGCRALVVDDNRDSADSLGMLLSLAGAEVSVAYDGTSALEAAARFKPHVAFLDVAMPDMSGYALAGQLRKDRAHEDMLLVAITGYGQEQDRLRSFEAGFDHHMVKPVDLDAMRAVIETSRRLDHS